MCLYSSEFQRRILKLNKEKLIEIDKIIKDYIGKIRQIRDCLFEKELIPRESKVETSKYRPMLWMRRRVRRNNVE